VIFKVLSVNYLLFYSLPPTGQNVLSAAYPTCKNVTELCNQLYNLHSHKIRLAELRSNTADRLM